MRSLLKQLIQILSIIAISPLIIAHLATTLIQKEGLFVACNQFLSLLPGQLGSYLRIAFNRFAMQHCDPECLIGFATLFSQSETEIEQGVYIGPQCNIGMCKIGKHTLIASGVHIMSGSNQHSIDNLDMPIQQQGGEFIKITIGEDCWIGNGCLVMADIGDKCVVGAGSVVTKPLPHNSIAVGNPARVVRTRGK